MRWVARALVGTSSIRGCSVASCGFPRGWGGLVPVGVAADGGAWLLIVALVGAALGACALRLLACCVAASCGHAASDGSCGRGPGLPLQSDAAVPRLRL